MPEKKDSSSQSHSVSRLLRRLKRDITSKPSDEALPLAEEEEHLLELLEEEDLLELLEKLDLLEELDLLNRELHMARTITIG